MEIGPNDPSLNQRWAWALVPAVLACGKSLLITFVTEFHPAEWILPGSFALLAALIVLSPPSSWWRIHSLRVVAYLLCWLPLLLSELGVFGMVAIAPFLLGASVASSGGFAERAGARESGPALARMFETGASLLLTSFGALWLLSCLASALWLPQGTLLLVWSGIMGLALSGIGLAGLASFSGQRSGSSIQRDAGARVAG